MKFDEFCEEYGIGKILKSYDSEYVTTEGGITKWSETVYLDDEGHVFSEVSHCGVGKGCFWTEPECYMCDGSYNEEVNELKRLERESKKIKFNESCSKRFKRSACLNESSEIQDDLEQLIKSAFIDKDLKQLIKNAFITKELDYANLTDEEKSLVQFIDGIRNGSRFLLNGHYENTENYEELVRGTFNKCAIVSNKYSNEFDYVSITKEDVVGASVPYTYLEIYNDGDLKITFDH